MLDFASCRIIPLGLLVLLFLPIESSWGQSKRPTSGKSEEKESKPARESSRSSESRERPRPEPRRESRPEPRRETRPEPRRETRPEPRREMPQARPAPAPRMENRPTNSSNTGRNSRDSEGKTSPQAGKPGDGNANSGANPGADRPTPAADNNGGVNGEFNVEFGVNRTQMEMWAAHMKQLAEEREKERERRKLEDDAREAEEAARREKQEREAREFAAIAAEISRLRAARDARADAIERDLERRKREQEEREEEWRRKQKKERDRRDDWDRQMFGPNAQRMARQAPKPPAKQAAEKRAAQAEQAAARVPLDAQALAAALDDLNSGDIAREIQALETLAKAVAEGDRETVAKAILPHLARDNPAKRLSATRALANWATAEQLPTLIGLLDVEDKEARHEVIRSLRDLGDPRAIEPLAKRLETPDDRATAAKALAEFGQAAEKVWRDRLTHEDMWVRAAAIDALAELGGPEIAEQLQGVADRDESDFVKRKALAGVRKIGGRPAN